MQGSFIRVFRRIVAIVAGASFLLAPVLVFAQTVSPEVVISRRTQLEQDLAQIEADIAAQQKILAAKQKESVSLERDVAILDAKIQEAKLAIKARTIAITKLSESIKEKEKTIGKLDDKLDAEKESLSAILRKADQIKSYSLAEVILSNKRFSDFLGDLDSFDSIKRSLQDSFNEIQSTRTLTQEQKADLEDQRSEQNDLLNTQQLQKKAIDNEEKQKQTILAESRGQEKVYKQILTQKEKSAASIRAELFNLQGSTAIPFERALEYANQASKKTGVRPALILATLAQESSLGENVGQCFLSSPSTGEGINFGSKQPRKNVMHPTRDVPGFMQITSGLGLDPFSTPVSCPMSFGYGGAMGPAQFIPSTWLLYLDKIKNLTGKDQPNPWNPADAFMASGMLLSENGAGKGTAAAERLAALRYFAGWKNATNKSYAFYGDGVMDLASQYQNQINVLLASAN